MFLLFHVVLTNSKMKQLFSAQLLIIIGGMCYSIYLLHLGIVSFAGKILLQDNMDLTNNVFIIPLAILLAALVLLISSIYFLVVEKPFMKPFGLSKRKENDQTKNS